MNSNAHVLVLLGGWNFEQSSLHVLHNIIIQGHVIKSFLRKVCVPITTDLIRNTQTKVAAVHQHPSTVRRPTT